MRKDILFELESNPKQITLIGITGQIYLQNFD